MNHEISIGMDGEVFIFSVNVKSAFSNDGYILLVARWDSDNNNYGPFFSFEEVEKRNEKEKYGILQYSVPSLEMMEYGDLYEKAIKKFNKLKVFI